MTCKEIRAHFHEDYFAEVKRGCQPLALLEHIAKCKECSCFVEEQKELAKGLLRLREDAPAVSDSLDVLVLAGYRSSISERSRLAPAVSPASLISPLRSSSWAAIAFVLIATAAVLLFTYGQRRHMDRVSTERPPVMSPPAAMANTRTAEPEPVHKKANSMVRSAKRASPAIPVALPGDWSSTSFQGLMYCDRLSCPKDMDVIRVQLPSAAVAFGPTSSKANDVVYADVLVGPDGIARGIRVVE